MVLKMVGSAVVRKLPMEFFADASALFGGGFFCCKSGLGVAGPVVLSHLEIPRSVGLVVNHPFNTAGVGDATAPDPIITDSLELSITLPAL